MIGVMNKEMNSDSWAHGKCI